MNVRKRLYFLLPAALAALIQHTIHELTHFLAARGLGEVVSEFRFLTNGMFTSQVIFATPIAERAGLHWLVIAWSPALVTIMIGYLLYLFRDRWLTEVRPLNAALWFATAYFLLVDPLYLALLAPFFGGGDAGAVEAVGWPQWPVHVVAGAVLVVNGWLVYRMRQEANLEPGRYLAPEAQ